MGQKTGNTLQSFQLLADEKRYDIAKTKFKLFLLNIAIASYLYIIIIPATLKCPKFNLRKQGKTESMDSFITDLYTIAKYSRYRGLHGKMIRDRIVVE